MPGTIILLLSAIFALAAISKLRSRQTFSAALRNLLPVPLAEPASIIIPIVELLLAVILLSGIAPQKAIVATITLLLVFILFLAQMHRRGLKGCGCFGEVENTASHRSGIARNLILVAGAAWVVNQPGSFSVFGPDTPSFLARITIVAGAFCLWPCLIALAQRRKFIFN